MPRCSGCVLGVTAALLVWAAGSAVAEVEEDFRLPRWEEAEVGFPMAPNQADCLSFYVSAATVNRFCVDAKSLSVGQDGVVRYTLIISAPSGVRNVSFEGMRCETREVRLYALGQSDGSWSKSRGERWRRISEAGANRHHATLFLEHFCPDGVIVAQGDEALANLRRGGRRSRNQIW